jgi:endoribonuclease LACTB2
MFLIIYSSLLILLKSIVNYLSIFEIFNILKFTGTIPKNLPSLVKDEQVSERCFRLLGLNPGSHTLHGTNCYLVGTGTTKILIDSGESKTAKIWVKYILDEILPKSNTTQISHILLTHGHYDHQGGVRHLLQVMKDRGMEKPLVFKRRITDTNDGYGKETGHYPAVYFDCNHFKDQQEFKSGDATLRVLYTPGHTDDSVVFVLLEDFALISGDSVLGCGTSVFDDLSNYMKTLGMIRNLMICQPTATIVTKAALHSIYPGHGPIVRDRALRHVDFYIENRNAREKKLLESLHKNMTNNCNQWISSLELVSMVYGNLSPFITISAQTNLLQHLNKLHEEGKVEKKSSLWDAWSMRDNDNKIK